MRDKTGRIVPLEQAHQELNGKAERMLKRNGEHIHLARIELWLFQLAPHAITFIWALYFLIDDSWFIRARPFADMRAFADGQTWGISLLAVGFMHAITWPLNRIMPVLPCKIVRMISMSFLVFFWVFVSASMFTSASDSPSWTTGALIAGMSFYALWREWST